MKFKLLSIGQKFSFQDNVYVKTSPIIASNVETGHNKMIPAYATLTLLDQSVVEEEITKKEELKSEDVIKAFNAFYAQCVNLIEDKKALDLARDQFLQSIV
ncbi:MAG: hypothetical protein QM484_08370 [Woeseiaceae bacterium]